MAKSYITLDTRIDTFKDEFNGLVNKVGDLATLTTTGDSDLVQAINEHSAELGTITATAMGTTASTVSTAIAELDAEADSDRSNFANNIRTIMLDPAGTGTSREVTASANNSTNETTFLTFVDGATGSQAIETDTGLTYNPSSGLITATSLAAATLDISGNVDIDGTTNLDAVDIDGAVQIDATVTVGVDDTGYDVKFFGDAASAYMQWDASVDDLILGGAARVVIPDGQLVLASTAVTSTATELNIMDGGTSASGTTLADADRVVVNDAGTMKQVALTDLEVYMETSLDTLANVTTVGALNAGSITSGFTSIDVGSGAITTTGVGTFGSLDISGNVDIDGTLEADAITVDGVTLAETISDTVGGMVGSNTETGITVTYEDADNTLDFVMGTTQTTITSITNAALVVGRDADNDIDFATDNNIIFRANGQDQIKLIDGELLPIANNDIDLGSSALGLRFKNADFSGTVTSGAFAGPLTGDVTGDVDGTAGVATASTISANNSTNETIFPVFVDGATGTQGLETDTGFTYNPSSGMLTASGFTGAVTGNVTGTADVATSVTATDNNGANENVYIAFVDGATGSQGIETHSTLRYNPSNETLVANITGNVTGNLTGQLTGSGTDQASITSLGTLTALQVDNININGNTISSTDTNGDINITPQGDGDILLDGAVNIRSGVVTGATSVTSNAFVGPLTGLASSSTILANARGFSITGDVAASAINFNGSGDVTLDTSLADDAVKTAKINADAVTNAKIADDAVDTENIADDAITAPLIDDGAVVTAGLASNAVTTVKITDANVTLAKIANAAANTIIVRDANSSGVLSAKAVTNTQILIGDGTGFTAAALSGDVTMTNAGVISLANNTLTTAKIADDAVTYVKMQNLATANRVLGSTSTGVIGEVQIATAMIATDAVTATKIGDDVINSEHYAHGSIDTIHIADAQITAAKIGADAVTAAKIGNDVINSEHYAAASIDREHLAADIIDGTKIADDVINSEHYAAGSIDNEHIADDAINSEHYADGSIDHAHLSADCVDKDNLATVKTLVFVDSAGTTLMTTFMAGA